MKKVVLGFFELCIHVLVYAFVIYLVYKAALFAYDYSYEVFGDPVMSKYNTETTTIVVGEGATASDVASQLKKAGLIKYESAFTLRVKLEKVGDKIMPGTFELSPNMTADEMIKKLTTEGDVKKDDSGGITR